MSAPVKWLLVILAAWILLSPVAGILIGRWLRYSSGRQVPAPRRRMSARSWLRIRWRLWQMGRRGPFRQDGRPLDDREQQAIDAIGRDLRLPAYDDRGRP
jgi:hypothetical protein